jgi:hypothetical protein
MRSVCRVLIGAVLIAQMAVSAYACPGLSPGASMNASMNAAMNPPMPSAASIDSAANAPAVSNDRHAGDCAGMAGPMDPEFTNLCAEHCRQGQQSDQAATLSVPAVLLTALYTTPLAPEPAAAPRTAANTTSALAAAAPPLAILHCCFRI